MIPIFIPSKDRACQLDLLLRSIKENCPDTFWPYVMYTSSNANYAEGYTRAIDRHKDWVIFNTETHAEDQLYGFLKANNIVGLFTDDCVFYRKAEFEESDIIDFFDIKNVWSVHLRLGWNITVVDYVRNKLCPQPNYNICPNDKFICWDYRFTDRFESYFAFPTPFDGSFYRSEDLLNLANDGHFDKIILWEHMICNNGRQQLMGKNLIVSPTKSHVVVQQINSSHSYGHYTNNTFNVSTDSLNKDFLIGKEIKIDSMDFSNVNCCHGEFKFILE